ncbi:MAG: hypothetical protein UX75_C0059G0012 [Candidatus Moranbacteria bacterium GW2011_GWE2_47_10]|nr:MAG: hypothetical protein UX75_C0059G0012 [Candidatus Moranbacteria bacterium GW2011_GWE2_47_10]
MSAIDYLCCKKCHGKIFYDEHGDLSDRLDDYFEGKQILCPDCVELAESVIDDLHKALEIISVLSYDNRATLEHARKAADSALDKAEKKLKNGQN